MFLKAVFQKDIIIIILKVLISLGRVRRVWTATRWS